MGVPAPRARALVAWAGVACAAATLALLADSGSADARQPAPGPQADPERDGELYQRWYAVRHATDGAGTAAAPPIDDASIALVDLTMRTGDMPLTDKGRGVREREFTDAEREATLGGAAGRGATVPAARGAGAIQVAQAVRAGTFQMPRFSNEQLADDELGDIVAFLDHEPATTPLGLVELNRVAAFASAMLLGAVIMASCWWTGTTPRGARPADTPDPAAAPSGDHDAKGRTP